ncbi:Mannose-6-phosphate isomerase / Mannose-1-phosphate guanylyl transferase [Pseudomonas marincola]|uniref:Alginate biosynthesis protein AlgA n=1 Tax=Pseudomonas marincola TaxID=437900 RepID=A0A653E4M7_9PSED|nr:mannose-1-phosphate guanylyltransferase/mannose-6-phosphate isomerase [Pseudomonas marincola]CAE6881463.1 Mannose-6-phosphate isomerase / Mannose-1-phosphate guanylyl transferase [Pseudomonas marincola]
MLVPVVLSGGAGTRLWPVSRAGQPKPFMTLPDGESLLQKTYRRAAGLAGSGEIVTVTHRDYYFQSRDHWHAAVGTGQPAHFILEPCSRNTAPAIAAAALAIASRHGDQSIVLIMPADHLIADAAAFEQAVTQACNLAEQGYLVTFGLEPQSAETGFGYIQAAAGLAGQGWAMVRRFVEKPDRDTAQAFVSSGEYLWNCGIFCATASTLLSELQVHAPELLAEVKRCVDLSPTLAAPALVQQELNGAHFSQCADISIDYALLEHSTKVAVVRASFDWSDIGSWPAVAALMPPDSANNRVLGDVLLVDSQRNLVHGDSRLIATLGVEDLLIVDTADAVLVAHANRAQDVRVLVDQLKATAHEAHLIHRTVQRPWGNYTVLEQDQGFKIKRVVVRPGAALSLQSHRLRSEHWVVVQGQARVISGDTECVLERNQSTYIAAGQRHRLANPGESDLVLIEVQSGDYLEEDDIVRYDDDYGRDA